MLAVFGKALSKIPLLRVRRLLKYFVDFITPSVDLGKHNKKRLSGRVFPIN